MALFSVIIPVYKVEKYLKKCVDSVLNQSFKDIEVILVNDGSPDNCPQICDDYSLKDNRVKVIHKENGGLSDARNAGINSATGEYLMFLDSDDYWNGRHCLESIVESIKEKPSDVLIYGLGKIDYERNKKDIFVENNYNINLLRSGSKSDILNYLFESKKFPGAAWTVAVRKSFILKNNIYFIKGIKSEDYDWLFNVFLKAESFNAVNESMYVYVKDRAGSITNTADLKNFNDIIFTIDKWNQIIQDEQYKHIKIYFSGYLAYMLATTFVMINNLLKEDKKKALSVVKKHGFLFQYTSYTKTKVIKKMIRFCGLSCTVFLVGNAYNMIKRHAKI